MNEKKKWKIEKKSKRNETKEGERMKEARERERREIDPFRGLSDANFREKFLWRTARTENMPVWIIIFIRNV